MKAIPGFSVCFPTTAVVSGRPLTDDDTHDDDTDDGSPAFSLAGELVGEAEYVPEFGAPRHLEVVSLFGETVTDLCLIAPGQSYYIGPDVGRRRRTRYGDIPRRRRLAQVTHQGAWITLGDIRGLLVREGKPQRLDAAGDIALMRPSDTLHLLAGDTTYHLRFASPPARVRAPSWSLRQRLRSVCWPAWGGALAFHLLALLVFGLFFDPSWAIATPPPVVEVEFDADAFPFFTASRVCPGINESRGAGDLFPLLCCLAEHDPAIYAGALELAWTVRRDGRARRVRIHPEPSTSAVACVENVVHGWSYTRLRKAKRTRIQFAAITTGIITQSSGSR